MTTFIQSRLESRKILDDWYSRDGSLVEMIAQFLLVKNNDILMWKNEAARLSDVIVSLGQVVDSQKQTHDALLKRLTEKG
jgi:hypothetical protein